MFLSIYYIFKFVQVSLQLFSNITVYQNFLKSFLLKIQMLGDSDLERHN